MRHVLGLTHSLPEWLIDDTADIGNARIFIVHAAEPRFVGELLPDNELTLADQEGITFGGLPGEQTLCRIAWWGKPPKRREAEALVNSLAEAIRRHDQHRGG